ncbi:glycoside hydrolase family 88 protein [Paenibacillus hemerocallicola]|nr:glycoside hydrolase family 88 protein [Paenibacillus hemerocallicola]
MRENDAIYEAAEIIAAPVLALPEQKRVPRGWSAVPIGVTGNELKLKWSGLSLQPFLDNPGMSARLRVSIAVEIREALRVEACLLDSGRRLGIFDIRYAYVFEPFELPLSLAQVKAAIQEGIGLNIVDAEAALWVFDDLAKDDARRFFTPHLMLAEEGGRTEQFRKRLLSLDSLQPFGWFEGCVLDGLYDMRPIAEPGHADQALSGHLRQYFDDEGKLRYEDLMGRPADGRFSGMESTLPVAVVAKRQPDHPVVDQLISYWDANLSAEKGTLSRESAITAEGAYTMGYPMAVIASKRQNEQLARMAVRQALVRRDKLTDGRDLYGIVRESGQREMRNWARSYTWYMLGLVRTWIQLRASRQYAELPGVREIEEEIKRISEVALSRREAGGLWSCFLGEPETGIETSGSAGIAAALALGARHGLLPQASFDIAREALQALERYLTPDGILAGVCQHNCGGLQLQRGGYRVLSQMGMGLMAQLYAAIHSER